MSLTSTEGDNPMMYFAILKGSEKYHLLVGFRYRAERDTFVKYSEFRNIKKCELETLGGKSERLCRKCEKAVYDQDGVRVAYIRSLYKPAMSQ